MRSIFTKFFQTLKPPIRFLLFKVQTIPKSTAYDNPIVLKLNLDIQQQDLVMTCNDSASRDPLDCLLLVQSGLSVLKFTRWLSNFENNIYTIILTRDSKMIESRVWTKRLSFPNLPFWKLDVSCLSMLVLQHIFTFKGVLSCSSSVCFQFISTNNSLIISWS